MTEVKPKFPSDAAGYQKLAEDYLAQGNLAEAIAACQIALDLQPDFAAACRTLGKALLGQGQIDTVAYTKAIDFQPVYLLWTSVSQSRRGGRLVYQRLFPLKTMLEFLTSGSREAFPAHKSYSFTRTQNVFDLLGLCQPLAAFFI